MLRGCVLPCLAYESMYLQGPMLCFSIQDRAAGHDPQSQPRRGVH